MEYKKILFSRLILSFFWTVILHIFPLSLYIFSTNFSLKHPLTSVVNSTLLVFGLETWISLIPLLGLLFTLGYVSSQELKNPPSLITSRFRVLLSFFTQTNILKWFLHVLLGLVLPWTYLKLNGVFFTKQCQDSPQNLCIDDESVFIAICCGWTAAYYFVRFDFMSEKYLQFPIIRQLRFLQIKSKFPQEFKNCFKVSFVPFFYFLPFYLWYGQQITSVFQFFLGASIEHSNLRTFTGLFNISLLFKAWLISGIYFSLVKTLQLMIQIHFTEHHSFTLVKQPNLNEISLPMAIRQQNYLIIQYLACYDLYIISLSQKSVRWQVFTLSQPGGHPHTWNAILHESIKLIDNFICEVEQTLKVPEPVRPKSPVPRHYHSQGIDFRQENMVPLSPNSKLRNLVNNSHMYPVQQEQQRSAMEDIWMKLDSYMDLIQSNSVINYIFGSKPDAKIRFLISNSQPLIWIIQSISELAATALMEDQFGIVLKDLPLIINTLLRLKFSLDKLGNIQKKFQKQDYDLCMKTSLKSALKRSLYRIAIAYSDYLTDLPLPPENLCCMKSFVSFKEC